MKSILTLIALLGVLVVGCGQENNAQAEASVKPEIVKVNVEGMTCNGCVNSIESAMAEKSGVVDCDVSLDENLATVSYDPSKTSPEKIVQSIEEQGYTAALSQ